MELVSIVGGIGGLVVGSLVNRVVVREPGYVITDPADLPDGADPALLDELAPPPADLPPVPILAVLQPRRWWRRWFPVTELLLAAVYAATIEIYGWRLLSTVFLVAETALIALAAVDFRVYRIPDRINFPSIGVTFGVIVVVSLVEGMGAAIVGAVAGGVLYAAMLFVAHLISPRGMGWGDVKLAWLMGLLLGWRGYDTGSIVDRVVGPFRWVLLGAVIGSLAGVVIGGLYAVVRRTTKVVFPYGPSLATGCIVAALWGEHLR